MGPTPKELFHIIGQHHGDPAHLTRSIGSAQRSADDTVVVRFNSQQGCFIPYSVVSTFITLDECLRAFGIDPETWPDWGEPMPNGIIYSFKYISGA